MGAPHDQILTGRITFSTHGFFIQLTDNGEFIDLSRAAVLQKNFDENGFNHKLVSLRDHMGRRPMDADPKSPTVPSLIASKVVLKSDIADRAYFISRSASSATAFDNWLRAERELLTV